LAGKTARLPRNGALYRIFRHLLYLLSPADPGKINPMRIAKPLLLVTTPLGLLDGFYECYKLAGGLLFLMVAMVGVMVAALGTVITTIRREERESKARRT
jgi:hypothetical protein